MAMAPPNTNESDAPAVVVVEAGVSAQKASAENVEVEHDASVDVIKSLKGWVFIVNPASASGSTGKKWPKMLQKFKDAATAKSWNDVEDVSFRMTTKPNEGITFLCGRALLAYSVESRRN